MVNKIEIDRQTSRLLAFVYIFIFIFAIMWYNGIITIETVVIATIFWGFILLYAEKYHKQVKLK